MEFFLSLTIFSVYVLFQANRNMIVGKTDKVTACKELVMETDMQRGRYNNIQTLYPNFKLIGPRAQVKGWFLYRDSKSFSIVKNKSE
jgi:hypothetical protein